MQTSLFPYIWRHTKREQIYILLVILVSMPFYFMSLDLPKTIVNSPIVGKGFAAATDTQPFLQFTITLPGFSDPLIAFPGISLERWPYLVALSVLFLLLVCVNGGFKYYINIFKGRMGERMLRRLRFDLVDRVMRFPPGQFKRLKSPEVATMVKDEVEPLGGFIGDAFVQPVFLGGQAITAMVFIIAQHFLLGMIALAIVGLQAYIIPKLRYRLLVLGKERQLTARDLAGRVGEVVDGIAEIRTNDATNWERADLSKRLGRIFDIRYELYNRKFFVKFLNNFLSQVTPFLFYLVGGYYALKGELDVGQLTAVIAAYKDLPSPIKELIDWDQQRQDVEIKFTQVMEQFQPDGMIDPSMQSPVTASPPALGPVDIQRLGVTDETGAVLVESVSLAIKPGERVAIVGTVNAGGETVADAVVRLVWPTTGSIRVGGTPIEEMPEAALGRRVGYAGPQPFFANLSIRDCLLYGLRHVPLRPATNGAAKLTADDIEESRLSGNTALDLADDWIDYEAAGVADAKALDERIVEVLKLVEMDEDVYQQGLRSRLDPARSPEIADKVLLARAELKRRLASPGLAKLVEPFDPDRYNRLATIAANLLFGASLDPSFEPERLASNRHVLRALAESGLDRELFETGRRIAETVVELFGDLPANHPYFEQLSFMTAEELPLYRAALARIAGQSFDAVEAEDRKQMLRLPFLYIEERHRLGLLAEGLQGRILETRKIMRRRLEADAPGAVAFYDPDAYNAAASLQDNILFGRLSYGIADGPEKVRGLIQQVLDSLSLHNVVYDAGLGFMVGSAGKRLTQAQRQKLSLARGLLKRPELLVINRGLNALDNKSQKLIIANVLRDSHGGHRAGVLAVLTAAKYALPFERVVLFEDGALAEDGAPADLIAKGGKFAQMVA